MKYRIAKKKLKRSAIINLWLKSIDNWYAVRQAADLRKDFDSLGISMDMIYYDWEQILREGHKIRIKERIIKKYYDSNIFKFWG